MTEISTAQFSVAQVNRRLVDLAARIKTVLEDPDVEAIHALRLSIRRLEPVLDVFKPCFASKRVKEIGQRLKEVRSLAGQVRDCDVALQLLSNLSGRGIAGLRSKIRAQRKAAASHLRRELETILDARLTVVNAQAKFCRKSVKTTARRTLVRLVADFFASGDRAAASSRTPARRLHQLRIATKQFRYTLELFARLCGRPAQNVLAKLRELQSLLGAVNNHRTVRDTLAGLGAARGVDKDLKKKQHRRMKRFRRMWKQEFTGALAKQWMQVFKLVSG